MSLKNFHLVFIAASLGLMAYLLYWARQRAMAGESQWLATAAGAGGLAAGLGYLRWFLRRYRGI